MLRISGVIKQFILVIKAPMGANYNNHHSLTLLTLCANCLAILVDYYIYGFQIFNCTTKKEL